MERSVRFSTVHIVFTMRTLFMRPAIGVISDMHYSMRLFFCVTVLAQQTKGVSLQPCRQIVTSHEKCCRMLSPYLVHPGVLAD
jgi:hypothetical protein